jgi:arylsulfatase A-like enzyme
VATGFHLSRAGPVRIPKGAVSKEFASTLDVFATLLKLGGGVSPASIKLDGYDILPVLTSGAASPRKEQFWEMFGSRGARFGNWKWDSQGKRGNPPSPSDPGSSTTWRTIWAKSTTWERESQNAPRNEGALRQLDARDGARRTARSFFKGLLPPARLSESRIDA